MNSYEIYKIFPSISSKNENNYLKNYNKIKEILIALQNSEKENKKTWAKPQYAFL